MAEMAELSPPASPTPTQSTISEHNAVKIPGRKKKNSPVWHHFDFDANSNKSVCTLKKAGGEVCGKEIKGKFPTNLRNHLCTVHPVEHAALLKKEEAEKTAREAERRAALLKVSRQLSLAESLKSGTSYTQGSPQYQAISRKLAIFIGCTNVPSSIVENIEFRDFVHTLVNDWHYSVPDMLSGRSYKSCSLS